MAFSLSSLGLSSQVISDYIFYYKNGRMYAQTDTGFTTSSTDAVSIMNSTMANLTSGGKCRVKGNMNIPLIYTSLPVRIPNQVWLDGSGARNTILKINTLNQDMDIIVNNAAGDKNAVSNLTIDGNQNTYIGGHAAFHFDGQGSGGILELSNVGCVNWNGYGATLDGTAGVVQAFFDKLHFTTGLNLNRCFDSDIGNSQLNSIVAQGLATCHIHDIYLGGGATSQIFRMYGGSAAYPNTGNVFEGLRADNGYQNSMTLEGYAIANTFIGCMFSNYDQVGTDNTYTCVHLQDNSARNVFSGCFFGDQVSRAKKWKYLIEEAGSSDYNLWAGCVFYDAGTAVTHTLGANSHVKSCIGQVDI